MATIQELGGTVKALEARVHTLEDVIAIIELKGRYTQIADSRQFARGNAEREAIATEMANLFTEDGLWDGGEIFGVYRSKKEIHGYFRQPSWKMVLHYTMNPRITVQGNKAQGQWHLFLAGTTKDNAAAWMGGFYDDEFVKINGQWFIKAIKPTFMFLTPYEDGWVKTRFITARR